MTNEEKMLVESLYSQGLGYKRIAAQTGISPNTVKSFLKKNTTAVDKEIAVRTGSYTPADEKRVADRTCSYTPAVEKRVADRTGSYTPESDCTPESGRMPESAEKQAEENKHLCLHCGKPIMQSPGRKQKKFCSDSCRNQWWNSHLNLVKRKAIRQFTCETCGKTFIVYGNVQRKYCSRACYAEGWFGGAK